MRPQGKQDGGRRAILAVRLAVAAALLAGLAATLMHGPRQAPSQSETLCIHQPEGGAK